MDEKEIEKLEEETGEIVESKQIGKYEYQIELWKIIERISKEMVPLVKEYYTKKIEKLDAPMFKTSTYVFGAIIVLIVIASTFLVYVNKLSSDSFAFLIGVLVGYVFSFVKSIVQIQQDE